MTICVKCHVSGKVQGVYYRGSTKNQANALGVTGYAKNLQDGRVEVLAYGAESAVESLCNWLWLGPQYASVSDVRCETIEIEVPLDRFTIG